MKSLLSLAAVCILAATGIQVRAQSTWVAQASGVTQYLNSVSFTDANNGTVFGMFGKILRTRNGGATWTQQTSGSTTAILQSVTFTDSATGTVVGSNGTILRTTNAGTTQPLYGISMLPSGTATIVGGNGVILRNTVAGSACNAPSAVTVSAISNTSATLSRPTVTGASGYEYTVNTSAAPPASGTAVTTASVTKTGLSKGTSYYAHVRTKCGTTTSAWKSKQFSTSTTSVEQVEESDPVLTVYPNPAAESIVIRCAMRGECSIMDMSGRVLQQVDTDGSEYRMDVSGYATGVYTVRFRTSEFRRVVKFQKK